MVNIIKEELPIEESLKRKLELICEFSKTNPTIINGNIRKIDKTNLTYIDSATKERSYYTEVDMSRYLATIINSVNHDSSLENIIEPVKRIQEVLKNRK